MTIVEMYRLHTDMSIELATETDPEMQDTIRKYLDRLSQRISNLEYENSKLTYLELARNQVPGM